MTGAEIITFWSLTIFAWIILPYGFIKLGDYLDIQ